MAETILTVAIPFHYKINNKTHKANTPEEGNMLTKLYFESSAPSSPAFQAFPYVQGTPPPTQIIPLGTAVSLIVPNITIHWAHMHLQTPSYS
jgi:hypothetical protein